MRTDVFMKNTAESFFNEEFDNRVGFNSNFGEALTDWIEGDSPFDGQPVERIPDAYQEAIDDLLEYRAVIEAFDLESAVNNPYGGAYYDAEEWARDYPRLEEFENYLNGLIACDWEEDEAIPRAILLTLEGEIFAALQEMLDNWSGIREALINEMLATV